MAVGVKKYSKLKSVTAEMVSGCNAVKPISNVLHIYEYVDLIKNISRSNLTPLTKGNYNFA